MVGHFTFMYFSLPLYVNPGPSFVFHFVNESPGALVFANSQQVGN